jgi:hypothetical protein
MATYPPVTPAPGQWADIPASAADSDIAAIGGDMWISDDAAPTFEQAFPLPLGLTYPVAAGRVMRCAQAGRGGSIRRLDRPA